MNLSVGAQTVKYLMFAFNLLFLITGIIIIAVGATVKAVYTDYSYFLDGKYFSLPNMLIATGSLILFISLFGCCGAFKESWLLLAIFSILLGVIFIFEFSAGIAGYVLRDKTLNYLDQTMKNDLKSYLNRSHNVWDMIQENFECCGVDQDTDWLPVFGNNSLPISCCPIGSGTVGVFYCASNYTYIFNDIKKLYGDGNSTTDESTADTSSTIASIPHASTTTPFQIGCKTAFGNFIKGHAVEIGGCAMGLAIMQILGVAFSCYLVKQLKNSYYST